MKLQFQDKRVIRFFFTNRHIILFSTLMLLFVLKINAQTNMSRLINIQQKPIKITDLLVHIKLIYPEYSFSYKTEIINKSDSFTPQKKTYRIDSLITEALRPYLLMYKNINNNIIIFKTNESQKMPTTASIPPPKKTLRKTQPILIYDTVRAVIHDTVTQYIYDTVRYIDTLKRIETGTQNPDALRFSISAMAGSRKNTQNTHEMTLSETINWGLNVNFDYHTYSFTMGICTENFDFRCNYPYTDTITTTEKQYNYNSRRITKIDTVSSYYKFTNDDTTWYYIINQEVITEKDSVLQTSTKTIDSSRHISNSLHIISIPLLVKQKFQISKSMSADIGIGANFNYISSLSWNTVKNNDVVAIDYHRIDHVSISLNAVGGFSCKLYKKLYVEANTNITYFPQTLLRYESITLPNLFLGINMGLSYYF